MKARIKKIIKGNQQINEDSKERIRNILNNDGLTVFPKAEYIDQSMIKLIQERFHKLSSKVLSKNADISIGAEGRSYVFEL